MPPPQERVTAIGLSPLTAPATADFTPGSQLTIEAWVYLADANANGWVAGKCWGAPGVDPFLSFGLLVTSRQRPEFACSTGASGSYRSIEGATAIAPRTWTHLAAVVDGTAIRLHVNGVLVASGAAAGPLPARPDIPFSVGIGTLADGRRNFPPFQGYARQVRLWTVARSAAQLTAAAAETVPADRNGLAGSWPLDDALEARSARDLSGASRSLTVAGLRSVATQLLEAPPLFAVSQTSRDDPASRFPKQGALLDFDGDGDLDLVIAQQEYSVDLAIPRTLRAFRNDRGRFVDVTEAVLGTVTLIHPRHQVVADFNGDGRADVLFAGHGYDFPPYPGEQSRLLLQTADGRLVEDPARLPSGIRFTHNVAAADVDRDGDVDLYLCNVTHGARGPQLFLNDGRGFFTEANSRLPPELLNSSLDLFTASLFVDVNRDGWPDLVLGALQGSRPGQGFPNQLLINDGRGRFVRDPRFVLPTKLIDASATVVNIETADFNGDHWPDLVLATDDWLVTPPDGVRVGAGIQLLLNRGDGTFRDATPTSGIALTPREVWTEWIYATDFTGDGRPDLVLQTHPSFGSRYRFLENLGGETPRFRDQTDLLELALPAGASLLVAGDVDQDGRPDLLEVGDRRIQLARTVRALEEPRPGRLANLSVRAAAGVGDDSLIAGFAIGGGASGVTRPLLVRAVGPTLQAFGVEGALADPALQVSPLGGAPLAANDNWGGTGELKRAFASVGAFPFSGDASRDAALLVAPALGAYTATVSGGSGVALLEVYDAGTGSGARLTNLSARTRAGSNAAALIAGFVVDGNVPKRLLIRAAGPTLAAFGVADTLRDPVLQIRPLGREVVVATNDDWNGATALKAAFAAVGAFPFSSDTSGDAALVVSLLPGAYTATVAGKDPTPGVALVEVYELP